MDIQFFYHHLFKKLSFPRCVFLFIAPLSKISLLHLLVFALLTRGESGEEIRCQTRRELLAGVRSLDVKLREMGRISKLGM